MHDRAVTRLELGLLAAAVLCVAAARAGEGDRNTRVQAVRAEISRLRHELDGLGGREHTTLGEIDRVSAEIRLREVELVEVSLRLDALSEQIARRDHGIATLAAAQDERREYLAFRLRELYKRGPVSGMRRLVGGEHLDAYLSGLQFTTYLSERDGRILREFRTTMEQIETEREALAVEHDRLTATRTEADRTRRLLARSRDQQTRILEQIRVDQERRREALSELEAASQSLTRVVSETAERSSDPLLDVRKFRGLLDWPAPGPVSAEFGDVVHPRFKTIVPHPGLDIASTPDDTFRSVFEGTVLYAAWLHGYGLTVIVDHGHAVVSIYAHASAVIVERGESVARGQALGRVGETGSLQGPYLYLEVREGGSPVDPRDWLRTD